MVGREVRTAEIEPFAPERDDTPGMLEKNKMKLALIGVWIVLVLPGNVFNRFGPVCFINYIFRKSKI